MTWRTHLMGGLVCSLAPLALLPPDTLAAGEVGLCALLAALGSLLPDLDASESHLKHLKLLGTTITPFSVPAVHLNRTLGHRGLLHSLLGLGIVALFIGVPLALFMGPLAAIALVLGYASHLALDACTKHGIVLLYPHPKRLHLLPSGFRVTTGSVAEEPVFVLLALLAMVLLLRLLAPVFVNG